MTADYVGRVRNNKENVRISPSSFHFPATTRLYIPLFPESATLVLSGYFSEEIKISISLKKAKEDSYDIYYLREQDVLGKIQLTFVKAAPSAGKSVFKKKLVIVTENITLDVHIAWQHLSKMQFSQ